VVRFVLNCILIVETLSEDVEVSLMSAEAEHDQVCIGSVDAVRHIGVVLLLDSLRPDEVQDFVLSLSRHEGIGENNVETAPLGARVQSLHDVELQGFRQVVHELSARSDHVGVEGGLRVVGGFA
jgi:hypothetical protein